ncbi:AAA domain-containing protein [Rhizobium brockwellii]|uniref:AAA domain-containing protein n=1 Tax=Rhizobium brockwellii TaxID=3019932 RepID=A0ABU3YXG2_9HYPH|nr:AAA domain-containing protein [Rhizobium brockwellii]MDV4183529.1 AAA domain-containing protein [Rhizobium brockwellii]MDV4190540.1 AAA domain-containing protein [Rhizobium brockwellii]
MTSKLAREVLVQVVEVSEDADELAIVMLDPGSPVSGSSHRTRARKSRFLTSAGRGVFWRNIRRVADGLRLIHEAGIVHGSVSEQTIFAASDDAEGYRLGGFEACIHISDGALGANDHLFDPSTAISFRQDWIDLARTARSIVGLDDAEGPALLAIERKMLDRMGDPPRFQLFDGSVVVRELDEVITEIGRAGTSAEGELVLYPAHGVAQRDFPSLTSGAIQASEMDEVFRFVEYDLLNPAIRAKSAGQDKIRLITDVAIYDLKLQSDFTATIENAHKRQASDWLDGAVEIPHRLQLSRHRGGADERVRKLGHGAKRWKDLFNDPEDALLPDDVPTWYALLLLEAFTLLREQFRVYPVQVITSIDTDEKDLVSVLLRPDSERDERRERLGLKKALVALQKEMRYDDGKPNWTLSASEDLVFSRERSPELSFEESTLAEGELTLTFTANHLPTQGERLFLRPKRDTGTERAIRRRLLNIVAARQNLELLRALDDPAQVALDDVLREIAVPGSPVVDMDPSKLAAWQSIVAGRSINVIVGPPGVGKTYLISNLVKSIMAGTPDARILVSAQNHETLVHMEDELRKSLAGHASIIVRVEKSQVSVEDSTLRQSSVNLLQTASQSAGDRSAITQNQSRQIAQTLRPVDNAERSLAERVLRDTDNLMLRSADVTLATTSSNTIEEMIADGEQFDWVFIEEAARANGAELIGALLLGNRRVMIGDHKQLSPFDTVERQRFYDLVTAAELLVNAQEKLLAISDLPPEVDEALGVLKSDSFLLGDVLAAAARLEEPFRTIAEREDEREVATRRPSSISTTLLEQSRMHPAICDLVSNTFYQKKLVSSDRVREREQTVDVANGLPASPIVLLDLPSLSVARRKAFEQKVKKSYKNEVEATALIAAMQDLKPIDDRCKENRDRVWQALDDACRRGVKCHLFFGTSIDVPKHAIAMHELSERLSSIRLTRGYVLAHRDSVESHAKFLVADDGQGGAVVSMGSCNWLSSPFSAVEVSVELTEANAAGAAMNVLQSIIAKISSAGQSTEALQFMAAELRRNRNRNRLSVANAASGSIRATMRILHAADHNRLLRVAAHDAKTRFICCTNRVGANMVPALFDPAEVASQRLDEVSIYYSRRGGPVKRGHVNDHRERLKGNVGIFGVPEPQLHAKFLAWDDDHIVVSSLNWGSQSATLDNPMDEIGLYLEGTGLATLLLKKFEAENTRAAKDA